ncbi:MAG: CHAT domain-containing protein [Chloroflexi bacterium]|nr:CHAT domain-containing protein [Chloroflexota bacterium]
MRVFSFQRASVAECPPEVVACFWNNWEIHDVFLDGKFSLQKLSEGKWEGAFAGLPVKFELMTANDEKGTGTYNYFVSVTKFGMTSSGSFELKYHETKDEKTSIEGKTTIEVGALHGFLLKILEKKIESGLTACLNGAVEVYANVWAAYQSDPRGKKPMANLKADQQEVVNNYLAAWERRKQPAPVTVLLRTTVTGGQRGAILEFRGQTPREFNYPITDRRESQELTGCWRSLVCRAQKSLARSPAVTQNELCGKELFYDSARRFGQVLYRSYFPSEPRGHFEELLSEAGCVYLLVLPHDQDSLIPWEVMHDGRDFVCLETPVARVTRGDVTGAQVPLGVRDVLVVGHAGSGSEELGQVEKEVERVSEAITESGLTAKIISPNASKQQVLESLKTQSYQILHYAGHSRYLADAPDSSHLILDKPLAAHELARLQRAPRLVFLNSCSSGQAGSLEAGNEGIQVTTNRIGLAHAFIRAGTPYVIGMLWRISDNGGFVLAQEFYKQLGNNVLPPEALRIARRNTVSADPEDPTWAAPVLYASW